MNDLIDKCRRNLDSDIGQAFVQLIESHIQLWTQQLVDAKIEQVAGLQGAIKKNRELVASLKKVSVPRRESKSGGYG